VFNFFSDFVYNHYAVCMLSAADFLYFCTED